MTPDCTGVGGRGCTCDFHTRRRRWHRDYAARRRARELDARNRSSTTCQKRRGASVCSTVLEHVTRDGRLVVFCPTCDRQARGICRDCPRPVDGQIGKALRCAHHKEIARREQMRDSARRNHDRLLQRARASYHPPDRRARRNEYKRQWRKANPEKVRAQKKRYIERHAGDPTSAYNRYHAKYRKRHRAHYRELQNTRNAIARDGWTPPVCTTCGKPTGWTPVSRDHPGCPWKTCMRCAWPHQRRERRRVRREAAKRIATDPHFGLPSKPLKVVRPRAAAVRGPGFERLCITPGCDIVVSHRKKKCTKCRARDRQRAVEALAAQRGRGRRTDLERSA